MSKLSLSWDVTFAVINLCHSSNTRQQAANKFGISRIIHIIFFLSRRITSLSHTMYRYVTLCVHKACHPSRLSNYRSENISGSRTSVPGENVAQSTGWNCLYIEGGIRQTCPSANTAREPTTLQSLPLSLSLCFVKSCPGPKRSFCRRHEPSLRVNVSDTLSMARA